MPDTTGKIGYLCSLMPEEIILAAGLQPVRIHGEAEATSIADSYLCSNMCPYIKNVMGTAIEGKGMQIDGMIFTRSCDGMRRLYDIWKSYFDTKFVYMLEAPKNRDEAAVDYYAGQLSEFAGALGSAFGTEVTHAALREAISTMNEVRKAMQGIFTLQKKSPLSLKGSELFEKCIQVLRNDKKHVIEELRGFAKQIKRGSTRKPSGRVRLMVSGNVMDRKDLLEIIEAAGADVAAVDGCTSLSYFNRIIEDNGDDPYRALAQGYLGKPHCARTASSVERLSEIRDMVKEYAIDGVILTSLKYCDLQLHDVPFFSGELTGQGIPVLFLENDYIFSNAGQLRTRVEAFIEVLNQGRQ